MSHEAGGKILEMQESRNSVPMWKGGVEENIHPAAQRGKKNDDMLLPGFWRKKKKRSKNKSHGLSLQTVQSAKFLVSARAGKTPTWT